MSARNFRRGVAIAAGLLLCVGLALLVIVGASYDGRCESFMPALASSRPCSFADYAPGHVLLYALVLGAAYWPALLAIVVIPPVLGFLRDRRA